MMKLPVDMMQYGVFRDRMELSTLEDVAQLEQHNGEFMDFVVDYNVSQMLEYDGILGGDYYGDEPLYFSNTYKIVGVSMGTLILAIGFTMNTLLIRIVKRCPSMFVHATASSLCRLLIYLAVADNLVLLTSCVLHVIELFLIFNQWVFGSAGCTMLVFLQYFSNDIVGLATMLLAIERYSTYSQKFVKMTVRRTGITIFLCSAVAVIFCSPWIALSKTLILEYHDIPKNIYVEECTFNISVGALSLYYLFDSILFYFVPLFVTVVLYILMFARVDRMQVAMDRQKEEGERQVGA